jgi:hypothetical protein
VRLATVILSTLAISPPVLYVAVVDVAAQIGRSADQRCVVIPGMLKSLRVPP